MKATQSSNPASAAAAVQARAFAQACATPQAMQHAPTHATAHASPGAATSAAGHANPRADRRPRKRRSSAGIKEARGLRMLALLQQQPMTVQQLFDTLRQTEPALRIDTVKNAIVGIRDQIHICDWLHEAGSVCNPYAVYRFGKVRNAPRPRLSAAEKQAKLDAADLLPVRRSGAKVRVARDPLVAAFFGA
jgi:hypothetical protein